MVSSELSTINFTVYIIELSDGSLYTGYTKNLENRLKMHSEGKGAKYVRGRLPLILRYTEHFDDKGDAMRREIAIKKFNRKKKLELIEGFVK